MTRTAIYARYSTDLQRDASIEDQIRVCEKQVRDSGGQVYQSYTDHAVSGASLMRPGIQVLMQDAAAGRFDQVYAEALDRISRDQEDIAAVYKRLTFAGVKLVTHAEGEINELHIGLKGTMNALFLSDLRKKTHRGLAGKVEKGLSGGGKCYGYDVVHSEERGHRTINEPQAAIVRCIFEDYAAGKSPKAIVFALNKEGVPGPTGKTWGQSFINGNRQRGTGILNNELYIGRLVWNRLTYMKNPETGKRVSKLIHKKNGLFMKSLTCALSTINSGKQPRIGSANWTRKAESSGRSNAPRTCSLASSNAASVAAVSPWFRKRTWVARTCAIKGRAQIGGL